MLGQGLRVLHQLRSKKGQVAVEYILLVFVAVALAAVIVSIMVSRDSEEPGFLIRTWQEIVRIIGNDHPGTP